MEIGESKNKIIKKFVETAKNQSTLEAHTVGKETKEAMKQMIVDHETKETVNQMVEMMKEAPLEQSGKFEIPKYPYSDEYMSYLYNLAQKTFNLRKAVLDACVTKMINKDKDDQIEMLELQA